MKANNYLLNRWSALFLGGLSVFMAVSCGSSQGVADRDGIYGDSRSDNRREASSSSAYYRDYFGNLHDETLVYTDAENYSSVDSTTTQERPREAAGYAGWGSEADNITVNVYGGWGYNNWYAPSWGWGWNSWYGPSWGWGWNSWYGPSWSIGWGWNSWYPGWYSGWYGPNWGWGYNQWYSPYWYGYNHGNYVYAGGRRGSYYTNGLRSNIGRTSYTSGTRTSFDNNTGRTRFNTTRTRDYDNNNSTIRNSGNTRNNDTRNNTGGIRQSQQAPVRSNSGNVRQSTPTRTYSPSSSNSGGTRSGSYGGSSGGGGVRSGGRR
jgi:hypothetical protein